MQFLQFLYHISLDYASLPSLFSSFITHPLLAESRSLSPRLFPTDNPSHMPSALRWHVQIGTGHSNTSGLNRQPGITDLIRQQLTPRQTGPPVTKCNHPLQHENIDRARWLGAALPSYWRAVLQLDSVVSASATPGVERPYRRFVGLWGP